MRAQAVLAALSMCFLLSCGTVTQESLLRQSELYASRIAFGWEKLGSFQLRGNARLQGSNLVARGPFVLWGDAEEGLLRGDFYGPDGRPVISVKGDSTGMLIYMPRDEYASFMPGGLRAGGGTISVIDLVHLLRTGYPLVMEAWEITGSASISGERIQWIFCVCDTVDHMVLSMENGDIFPSECEWRTGAFTIRASSPHDEYNAWPWNWSIRINDRAVDLELTEINISAVPWEGIWEMTVPIPVDTVDSAPFWQPELQSDRR
ncbi:MAG: hypothetical protein KAT09_03715 [Candidatus Aegiribacteria sp.]|nr:hypothetical protein [Candidatus Aegiribacteria sp.]